MYFMKIEGPGKAGGVRGTSKTDSKNKAGGSAFSGLIGDAEEAGTAASVRGPSSIAQLDALLSLQEAGAFDSEEARQKAKKRAALLLDQLDQIRMGLLSGGIPKSSLEQLSRMVSQHRDSIMDPALQEILDDIDLRAQVELAKHNR